MLQLTAHTPALSFELTESFASALLTDPEFLQGFAEGVEMYEAEVEKQQSTLTTADVQRFLTRELDSNCRASEAELDRTFGFTPIHPLFYAGAVAGWTAVHMARVRGCSVPVAALPMTGPLAEKGV